MTGRERSSASPPPAVVGRAVVPLQRQPDPAPAMALRAELRPGSRAARLSQPLAVEVVRQLADEHGVCGRPIALRRTDLSTGVTEVVDVPCGATREDRCRPCAGRAKRLRQQQCRDGWHRPDEPLPEPDRPNDEQRALIQTRAQFLFERGLAERYAEWEHLADLDEGIASIDEAITRTGLRGRLTPVERLALSAGLPADALAASDGAQSPAGADASGSWVDVDTGGEDDGSDGRRRNRSTRRREDVPDLPRHRVAPVTVGRTFTGRDGRVFQPSTFLTVTLDSYGRVNSDGTPVDPEAYDYRRAAWDAIHFPALLDRFWQNLRRAAGWNVQYFGSVEPQRRLAPHAHFAMRGTIPRDLIRRVAAATYRQIWWPAAGVIRYSGDDGGSGAGLPVWDSDRKCYMDPTTRIPLPSWDDALDRLDELGEDAEPVHVARFGPQLHVQGVLAGSPRAVKAIGYLTKYLSKSIDQCHRIESDRQRQHAERLWQALRFTPCSPRCANWLRYGIQPDKAKKGLRPGHCRGRVHQRGTLGMGGRRVLVSRDWSGKTLADQRYDNRAWLTALLGQQLTSEESPVVEHEPGTPIPYAWELAHPSDRDVPPIQHRLLRAIGVKLRQRQQVRAALRQRAPDRTPTRERVSPDVSATSPTPG